MVMQLWPGNWQKQLRCLDTAIAVWNDSLLENRKIKEITEMGFWVLISLLLSPTVTGRTGQQVFSNSILPTVVDFNLQPNLAQLLFHHFNLLHCSGMFMEAFKDVSILSDDNWHQPRDNDNQFQIIASSLSKTMDESMLAFKRWTTMMGNLPHLSFMKCKPEPLGAELKTAADSSRDGTGLMIHLELQERKNAMRSSKEHLSSLDGTAACTLQMPPLGGSEKVTVGLEA
jgi:hypothetical protein